MKKYYDTVIDSQGNAVSGASVVVTSYPSDGAVSIYLVNNTSSPVAASTLTTDVTGFFYFYAPDGQYILKIYDASGNLQRTISDVQIVDDAWQNGVAISTTPPTAGQVLTADSSSTASWHTVSAGLTGFTEASNTGLGTGAGDSISGGPGQITAIGVDALTANSNGYYNTAVGNSALMSMDTGSSATAVGTEALKNSTSTENTAVGAFAGRIISSGTSNTAVGALAMSSTTTNSSSSNTAIGYEVMPTVSNSGNTALGTQALKSVTNAVNNCAIGRQAGYAGTSITTGSANTLLGDSAQVNSATASHRTVIGNTAIGIADNTVQLGAAGENVACGAGAIATNATDGFLNIPSCAGPPTGTPTAIAGLIPIVIDSTNLKLYARIGGAWKSVTLA